MWQRIRIIPCAKGAAIHPCNGVAYTGWDSSTSLSPVNGITSNTPHAFKRRINQCPGPLDPGPVLRIEPTNFIRQVWVETRNPSSFPRFGAETRRLRYLVLKLQAKPWPSQTQICSVGWVQYTGPSGPIWGRATAAPHCLGCVNVLLSPSRNGRAVNDAHNDSSF
jgi:hypothetical protein